MLDSSVVQLFTAGWFLGGGVATITGADMGTVMQGLVHLTQGKVEETEAGRPSRRTRRQLTRTPEHLIPGKHSN